MHPGDGGYLLACHRHGCANAHAASQVLRDCIPYTVYQYLSSDHSAPVHTHKSIILNLACGATIGTAESRSCIFKGYVWLHTPSPIRSPIDARHCADAVLSFSHEITLVASVAAPLLDFASTWAQSSSDYDFIIARAFPPSWCSLHRPVLSRPDPASHSVYSAIDPLEPDGCPVICHRGCGCEHLDPTTISQKVKVKCILCCSTCEVKVTEVNGRTHLGRRNILKVVFPAKRAETNWAPPKEPRRRENTGATEEAGTREARGRQPTGNPSQARRGRGGVPLQRPQTHSVPCLPSETLSLPVPPMRTMSQTSLQYPYPAPTPHTPEQHTPSTQFQGLPQLHPFPRGWLPATNPLSPPPPQAATYPQRQAKRQKTKHISPAPP